MKIDDVDYFYLSTPRIENIGDGSQDALLVRMRGYLVDVQIRIAGNVIY